MADEPTVEELTSSLADKYTSASTLQAKLDDLAAQWTSAKAHYDTAQADITSLKAQLKAALDSDATT